MAVELRCPDCRAKLRLKDEPDPGDEVECPECGSVFTAPDPDAGDAPDRRAKKKPADDEDDDKPRKKKKRAAEDGGAAADKPKKEAAPKDKTPRKRKAKKKETNRTALILVSVGGVLFMSLLIGLLIWFFTRKPASYEMMNYLPADATNAVGLNIGHMNKYSEFIKVVEPTYKQLGFQKAIEALATALGTDAKELPDYMVEGWGKSGGGMVIRTKKEFEPDDLKKLPGAREGTQNGQTYYQVSPIPKLWGGTGLRVFAPTRRLVVFCPGDSRELSNETFGKMLGGNKDNLDDTLPKRLGQLGTRTTRGTFWVIGVLDTASRPVAPKVKENENAPTGAAFKTQVAASAASAQGFGFKASLGSRSVRFEVIVWCRDAENASENYKKYKESDLAKGDDVEPPRWWKDFGDNVLGSKKAANELLSNLGAKASGELFIVYSECDTNILMEALVGLVNKITGQNQAGGMMAPGAAPGAAGGGALPPPPPPVGGGGPGPMKLP